MHKLLYRMAAVVVATGAILVGVISAQSGTPAGVSPSSSDALLAEIRALRADLNHRLDATLRAQLLVARLQVQEQRIATLSREMSEVQQQLQNSQHGRTALETQLKTFEDSFESAPESDKKGFEFMLGTLRKQVEGMAKNDEELKRRELYLSGVIADEQARWTAFNARLEELERLLTPAPAAPPRDR